MRGSIALLAFAAAFSRANAQVTVVESVVECAACTLVVQPAGRLEGPEVNGAGIAYVRARSGEIFVVDRKDGLLRMFGADGKFVRQIGRRGPGPGEYQSIRNVLVADDGKVTVIDGGLGRRSTFDAQGRFLSSSTGIPQGGTGHSALMAPDGQVILNVLSEKQKVAGFTLQRVDSAGTTTARFDEALLPPDKEWFSDRLLAGREGGEFWVAKPLELTLDLYSTSLQKKTTLMRRADWLKPLVPTDTPSFGLADEPFTPRLTAIWSGGADTLWAVYAVASPQWKPFPASVGPNGRPSPPTPEASARPRAETIVEVIDTRRGKVLVRQRFTESPGANMGGGYFAHPTATQDDEPVIEIRQIKIKR